MDASPLSLRLSHFPFSLVVFYPCSFSSSYTGFLLIPRISWTHCLPRGDSVSSPAMSSIQSPLSPKPPRLVSSFPSSFSQSGECLSYILFPGRRWRLLSEVAPLWCEGGCVSRMCLQQRLHPRAASRMVLPIRGIGPGLCAQD